MRTFLFEEQMMAVDKKLNLKFEQQIALWAQKQEELRRAEDQNEPRPIAMEANHEP